MTVLSNSWSDANAAGSTSRLSAAVSLPHTTVNAAIMAGNKDTVGTQYSGGVENFMRFLETWSGKTLTYAGSLTCLWQSQQATGNWPGTGTVYNPPTRNWAVRHEPGQSAAGDAARQKRAKDRLASGAQLMKAVPVMLLTMKRKK